jgi:ATP-dependent Lhr-like helicase
VTLSRRAVDALRDVRMARVSHVEGQGTVVHRVDDVSWWTWAGARANATLANALSSISDPEHGYDNHRVRLRPEVTREEMAQTTAALGDLSAVRADVNEDAVRGLKFSDVLPPRLGSGHGCASAHRPRACRAGGGRVSTLAIVVS